MRLFIILILSISFTQELQIEGDLTVSGEINSAVIDSLQNQITEINSIVANLVESVNSNYGYRLLDFNQQSQTIWGDPYVENELIYEISFEPGTVEQLLRVEFRCNQNGWLTVYYGIVGNETSVGSFGWGDFDSSNQHWVTIPIENELINETTRLTIYVTRPEAGNFTIGDLFIWGK
jgi:hypothetical protein